MAIFGRKNAGQKKVKIGDITLIEEGVGYGSWKGAQVSVQHGGKKMDVRFGWKVENVLANPYENVDDNYLTIDVSRKILGFPRKFFSDQRRVGTDTWHSGRSGAQCFEDCMKSGLCFRGMDENSPVMPFLKLAREKVNAYFQNLRDAKDADRKVAYVMDQEELAQKLQEESTRKDPIVSTLIDIDKKSRKHMHREAPVAAPGAKAKPLSPENLMAFNSRKINGG